MIDSTGDGAGNTLSSPEGLVVAPCGTIYVAGGGSNNVFRISPAGLVTQVLDGTGDGTNPMTGPTGLALDASGNVFVSCVFSNNVFRVTPTGVVTQVMDATGDGLGNTLSRPRGLAVDASGNLLVAGQLSNNAFRVTPGGVVTEIIDATGDGGGNTLNAPWILAADGDDALVAGRSSNNVFRVTPGGVVTEIIDSTGDGGGNTLLGPTGVAAGPSGNVYVTSVSNQRAFKIEPGGTVTQILDVNGDGTNGVLNPWYVTVSEDENVYVSCLSSSNAFEITPGGTVTEIIDSTGDGSGNTLSQCFGLAVQPGTGSVFVSGNGSSNAFRIEGSPSFPAFCDASDGALGTCPCAAFQGLPTTGCDTPISPMQGGGLTGGFRLDVLRQTSGATNRATLCGTGFPQLSAPGVTVIRAPNQTVGGPFVFGDGVLCIGPTVVRVGADLALGGTFLDTVGHGSMAGPGSFYYQLWVRSTPISFCDPSAAFNLSNGREIVW